MTVLTGTSSTIGVGTAGGIREDLSDMIFDLFPEDTWALTTFDREDASSTYTEWLAQELAAPAANIQIEGDDASFASLTPPTRYANQTQISSKTFLVSDTLEAVNKAGRKSELARGAIVKMRELKRDIETRITQNGIATAGGAGTGRSAAGIESWIGGPTADADGTTTANAVRATSAGTTGTTPPTTSGAPGTAPTDPTTGALAVTALNQALMGAWAQGGDPTAILAGVKQKGIIDTFTGIATRFVDTGRAAQASIIGAANAYVSDFGNHTIMLHRYMRSSIVLCLDPNFWATRWLRKIQKRKLAKTGDGEKFQIIGEWTLVARNWKANSKVVGCA